MGCLFIFCHQLLSPARNAESAIAAALLEQAAQQVPEPAIASIVVKLAMPELFQVDARSIKWRSGASQA